MNLLYIIWNIGAYFTKEDGTRVQDEQNIGAYKGDNKAYNDPYTWVENLIKPKTLKIGDWEILI